MVHSFPEEHTKNNIRGHSESSGVNGFIVAREGERDEERWKKRPNGKKERNRDREREGLGQGETQKEIGKKRERDEREKEIYGDIWGDSREMERHCWNVSNGQ